MTIAHMAKVPVPNAAASFEISFIITVPAGYVRSYHLERKNVAAGKIGVFLKSKP